MTWKTSLLILFATVMVAFVPLSAYAAVDDGNLRKITSDGQYDVEMSWQPAGHFNLESIINLILRSVKV